MYWQEQDGVGAVVSARCYSARGPAFDFPRGRFVVFKATVATPNFRFYVAVVQCSDSSTKAAVRSQEES